MGSWQLEVFKMFLYVMFPVGAFHVFNQPQIYDKWVTQQRDKYYPPISPETEEQIKQMKLEIRKRKQEKYLAMEN